MIEELNIQNETSFFGLENLLEMPIQFTSIWKKILEKTYGNVKGIYFFEKNKKEIFASTLVTSSFFGNKLVAQPFIDFGGFNSECDEAFVKAVLKNLRERSLKNIVIKMNDFVRANKKIFKVLEEEGFAKMEDKNQIVLKIKDELEMWENFKRVTRKGIKKALKNGLQVKEITSLDELKKFYGLYLENQRSFGSPQHSFKFFENWFMEETHFVGFNCYLENKLVGSLLGFYNGPFLYAAFQGLDRNLQKYQGNDLLHWELIKWCSHHGIKYFDFGECETSPSSNHARGILDFKMKWVGEEDFVLQKYVFSSKEERISERKNSLKKFRLVWKCLPMFVTKFVGPKIISQLG